MSRPHFLWIYDPELIANVLVLHVDKQTNRQMQLQYPYP